MTQGFVVKGWCPGALQPMQSGDGLIVRARPRLGFLTSEQTRTIAACAQTYGNGLIELTSRANLQLRGVRAEMHASLVTELATAGLVDLDIADERRCNVIVTPSGGAARAETLQVAAALETALKNGPVLPAKFGFVVDTGVSRTLATVSGDVRIERCRAGGLIVRADGAAHGRRVRSVEEAVSGAVALAAWFAAEAKSSGVRRMAPWLRGGAVVPAHLGGDAEPTACAPAPTPGAVCDGFLVGAEFGQLDAHTFAMLTLKASEVRITPWRMILVVGGDTDTSVSGLIQGGDDPRLRVSACCGAPACPQGLAPTRELARYLADYVPTGAHLHVSGCTKGCARQAASAVVLCATRDGFSLIRDGTSRDRPSRTGLSVSDLHANPSDIFKAS